MKFKPVLFCIALTTAASAADAPVVLPQSLPLAPSTGLKSASADTAPNFPAIKRLRSPTISETSVVRQADGSLAMHCVQKPNPKIRERAIQGQSVGPRQP